MLDIEVFLDFYTFSCTILVVILLTISSLSVEILLSLMKSVSTELHPIDILELLWEF